MKLSTWRPGLIDWLDSKVTIDSWLLNTPQQPGEVNAFLPPMSSIKFFEEQGQNRGSGSQGIMITVRYPYTVRYEQLPINDLEAAYISISYGLFHDAQAIADVISIEVDQTELSITVTEDPAGVESPGLDFGDWIITLKFYINVLWAAEPEITSITDGIDDINITVTKINLGLWRKPLNTLDDSEDSLDTVLTFD